MRRVPQISAVQAAALVKPGSRLLVGGFGMTGQPVALVSALARLGTGKLTLIANNAGEPGLGSSVLLQNGQLVHLIGSYFTSNPEAVRASQAGTVTVELLPQGTFAEALRAGGAGIPAFYVRAGAETDLARERESRAFEGIPHLLVHALRGDVAFVRAWQADEAGNLAYRMTEQNFNPAMATAADLVVAEVEEIVPVGQLDPNAIQTPGVHVDYLVQAHLDPAALGSSGAVERAEPGSARERIARRAVRELRPGDVVNLGIGIPILVADWLTDPSITVHTENGMLGVGPSPEAGSARDYPVNAGKVPVTALPGASYFDSAESFGLIRGGHVDVAIMGALQVDAQGSLANWATPGKPILGVGGAMDLGTGARRVIITMTHVDSQGRSKIVERVTLPVTAHSVVDTVITDLAVFRIRERQLFLTELMPGADLETVRTSTAAPFVASLD